MDLRNTMSAPADGTPYPGTRERRLDLEDASGQKRRLGSEGEDFAARYLERLGWRVLERNWRCRDGEIDIVAADGDVLVIVEVKTRRSTHYGSAVEAVTPTKLARLRHLGARFAQENEVHASAIRVDVLGLHRGASGFQIDHRRGVRP